MSTTTLAQLRAYEAKLTKAMGDPAAEVWFDDFRKKNRPISELKSAMDWVRGEIARHPDTLATSAPRPRRFLIRGRSGY